MASKSIQLSDHFTYKKLLRFTLPSIGMMIFMSIYSVVDGYFVSNFAGKTPFAALNLIFPVLMIMSTVGFMFGTGGSAIVAKTFGLRDRESANRYFSLFVYVAFGLGVILAVISIEKILYCISFIFVCLCSFVCKTVYSPVYIRIRLRAHPVPFVNHRPYSMTGGRIIKIYEILPVHLSRKCRKLTAYFIHKSHKQHYIRAHTRNKPANLAILLFLLQDFIIILH